MKKIMICLLLSTLFLTACSINNSQDTTSQIENDKVSETTIEENDGEKNIAENTEDESNDNQNADDSNNISEDTNNPLDNKDEQEISEKVKEYIINGQEGKPEAQKLNWSNSFLNQVDIESLYNQYIAEGGSTDDLEKFAEYMTINAPIPDNWEELFKKDLFDVYGKEVVRLEHIEGDLYQAYVNIDGSEVPYVAVSARTGYFHG